MPKSAEKASYLKLCKGRRLRARPRKTNGRRHIGARGAFGIALMNGTAVAEMWQPFRLLGAKRRRTKNCAVKGRRPLCRTELEERPDKVVLLLGYAKK